MVAEVQDVRVRAREGGVDVGVIARHRHLLGGAVAAEPAELGAALAILGEVRAESGDDHREGGDAKLAAEAREGELGAVHAGNRARRGGAEGGGGERGRQVVRGARATRHLDKVRVLLRLGGGGGSRVASVRHGRQARELSRHEVVRHRVAAAPRMTQGDHVHATRARENMTREEETAAVTTRGWQHSRKSM